MLLVEFNELKKTEFKDTAILVLDKAQKIAKLTNVEVTDEHVLSAIKKEIKENKETLHYINMADTINKEAEAKVEGIIAKLESYLPEQLSEDEIVDKILIIIETEELERSMKSMGTLMKLLKEDLGDSADFGLVSKLVKQELNR